MYMIFLPPFFKTYLPLFLREFFRIPSETEEGIFFFRFFFFPPGAHRFSLPSFSNDVLAAFGFFFFVWLFLSLLSPLKSLQRGNSLSGDLFRPATIEGAYLPLIQASLLGIINKPLTQALFLSPSTGKMMKNILTQIRVRIEIPPPFSFFLSSFYETLWRKKPPFFLERPFFPLEEQRELSPSFFPHPPHSSSALGKQSLPPFFSADRPPFFPPEKKKTPPQHQQPPPFPWRKPALFFSSFFFISTWRNKTSQGALLFLSRAFTSPFVFFPGEEPQNTLSPPQRPSSLPLNGRKEKCSGFFFLA